MRCRDAQEHIMLAQYGELADELQFPLEQHLSLCEACRREWKALLALNEELALAPVVEPSPNLLTASRMRLDEALDAMPPRSVLQRFWGNAFRWLGFVQGAPALATLLLGIGFLSGDFIARYQAHKELEHVAKGTGSVVISGGSGSGPIASVSGVVQTPNSDLVQVNYNRLVPETLQAPFDDPQVRKLLLLGTKLGTSSDVHAQTVAVLARSCLSQQSCGDDGGEGFRNALLISLREDKSPAVRLQALAGLQPYVAQDENVRDALLESLMHDKSAEVRTQAIALLTPVQADSSVRQVLRTVSSQDANPAIRNASYQALQGADDIQ